MLQALQLRVCHVNAMHGEGDGQVVGEQNMSLPSQRSSLVVDNDFFVWRIVCSQETPMEECPTTNLGYTFSGRLVINPPCIGFQSICSSAIVAEFLSTSHAIRYQTAEKSVIAQDAHRTLLEGPTRASSHLTLLRHRQDVF